MLPVFIVFYPYLWQIHLKWIESNDSNPIFGVWTRTQWCCCHWEILRQLEMPTWSKISIQVLNDDGSTLPSIGSPVDLAEKNAESTESKIIRCTKNVHMLVPTRRIFPHFSTCFHDWQCCCSVGSWATCDAEINGDLLDAFLEKATGSQRHSPVLVIEGQLVSPRLAGQATSKLEAPGDYLGHLAASHIVTSRPTDGLP